MKHLSTRLEQHIFPLLCFAAVLNALLPPVIVSLKTMDLTDSLITGFGHSHVIWLCLVVAMKLTYQTRNQNKAIHPGTGLLLLMASLLLVIPSATLSWLICITLALFWRYQKDSTTDAQLAAVILIAIAVRDPVCQSFLHLFAQPILAFDAWISSMILILINNPATVSGNTVTLAGGINDGHSLLILTGCSAFTNLSLALLLWFTFTLYHQQYFLKQDYLRAVLLVSLILTLNGTRLAMMAIDESWYHLLHEGRSQEVLEFLTIVIALICIRRSSHHENTTDTQHPADRVDHRPV